MGGLERRIAALEKGAGADNGACECGNLRIVYALETGDQCDDPEPICKRCGRERVTLRVVWGYGEKGGHGQQEEE